MPARAAEERPAANPSDTYVRHCVVALFAPSPTSRSEAPRWPAAPAGDAQLAAMRRFAQAMKTGRAPDFDRLSAALLDDPALPGMTAQALRYHRELEPTLRAARLRAEERYNLAAESANALIASGTGLAAGNPTVLSRVSLAIARLFGRGALTRRERRELVLLRAMLDDPAMLRAAAVDAAERTAMAARAEALEVRRREEFADLMRERVAEAARFGHDDEATFFARALARYDAAASKSLEASARQAQVARRRARGFSLTFAGGAAVPVLDRLLRAVSAESPAEMIALARSPLVGLSDSERTYLRLIAAATLGDRAAAQSQLAALASARDRPLAGFADALTHDGLIHPAQSAKEAERYFRARVSYYVWAGRRDFGDDAYTVAYGAVGGGVGLANVGIFYGLDAVIRWLSSIGRAPIPPEDAVDAWARAADQPGQPPHERALALRRAAELWAYGGEAERALGLARTAARVGGAGSIDVAAYREAAAHQLLARARPEDAPGATVDLRRTTPAEVERRRTIYRAVERLYPRTKAAAKAAEERAALGAELPAGTRALDAAPFQPGGAWRDSASLLPVDRRLLDGDTINGEVARFLINERDLSVVAELTVRAKLPLPRDPRLGRTLLARAAMIEEAELRAAGLEQLVRRQYLPVKLEGGFGGGGFDLAPQLKEIPFRGRDVDLYGK